MAHTGQVVEVCFACLLDAHAKFQREISFHDRLTFQQS